MENSKCQPGTPWPVIIYGVLAILGIILTLFDPQLKGSSRWVSLGFSIVWAILWAGIIWWLWDSCHKGWAWFVLFLPFIIGFLIILLVIPLMIVAIK